MAKQMPPPGHKPALIIGIGGAPSGMDPDAPPKSDAKPDADPDGDNDTDSKMPPEKAMVIRGDQHCSNCSNYHGEDGSCDAVEGQFDPTDACFVFFQGMGDEDAGAGDGSSPMPDDSMPQGAGVSS